MSTMGRGSTDMVQVADRRFFEIFLPREIKLMQQFSKGDGLVDGAKERFLGLFLIRLEPTAGATTGTDISSKTRHLLRLINSTIRYYDIPGQLSPYEFLVVIREIEPSRARLIASRLVGMASRSRVLSSEGVRLRIGYIVYPFSIEPDLTPTDWPVLVDLTRRLSNPVKSGKNPVPAGYGLIRGPEMGSPTIPEADIVNLATTDLGSLTQAKLLILEPIATG